MKMTLDSRKRSYRSLSNLVLLLVVLLGPAAALSADSRFPAPVTARGDLLILEGRLLDTEGRPVTSGSVEIWQTDAAGVYDHPGDRTTANRDRGFQFFGTSVVDDVGAYRFRTILPGRYQPRPRHIHVKVRRSGEELLTTQFYFAVDGDTAGVGGSNRNLRIDLEERRQSDGRTFQYGVFDIIVNLGGGGRLLPTDRQSEGPYYPVVDVSRYDNDLANSAG